MPRTENDTWDLASSVGATATGVAAARALASRGESPLIDDPFAESMVRAVGVDYFTKMAHGQIEPNEDGALLDPHRLAEGMAIRTMYFDDFLTSTTDTGVRQIVILAAGLDALAVPPAMAVGNDGLRGGSAAGHRVQGRILAELGATPTATLHSIGIDLREDWPTELLLAGFDPTSPTAWIAEGLLGYLPPAAQDRLFDHITELSEAGSRIATDWVPDIRVLATDGVRAIGASQRAQGLDLDDPSDLVYQGERNSVVDYLRDHGWLTETVTVEDAFEANGLVFHPDEAITGRHNAAYTSARLA